MTLRLKNVIYTLGLLSAVFLVWHYRNANQAPIVQLQGETMGTTYHITYFDDEQRNFKPSVDSLLVVFNQSLSTYIPTSEISKFNKADQFAFDLPYFFPVLQESQKITRLTEGAFDPTVMPLVNAWGFGPDQIDSPDSTLIDSVRQYVGFNKVIEFNSSQVRKLKPGSTLDFSALAKGYGVDIVADFLADKGIENLFVEIGGEVVVKGRNEATGDPWKLAIIDPESEMLSPEYIAHAELVDQAMATSANNFNYRIVNGVKYSHTISPFTGYPIKHEILSATVFAPTCMQADALATAFMVMGHEKAIELLQSQPYIHGFLVYSDGKGGVETYTSGEIHNQITLLDAEK